MTTERDVTNLRVVDITENSMYGLIALACVLLIQIKQGMEISHLKETNDALRHEIQTTQQLIYALKDDKQKDKAN